MKNLTKLVLVLAMACLFTSAQAAELDHSTHNQNENNEHRSFMLSSDVQELLTEEMFALQKGMQEIIPALAAGHWKKLQSIGQQIHDSFIMKKNLSQKQMHELHEKLPEAFQTLDHNFHHTAGQLASAAEKQDGQLVSFYFYKLTESCIECHAQYAKHKFPALSHATEHEEHEEH